MKCKIFTHRNRSALQAQINKWLKDQTTGEIQGTVAMSERTLIVFHGEGEPGLVNVDINAQDLISKMEEIIDVLNKWLETRQWHQD